MILFSKYKNIKDEFFKVTLLENHSDFVLVRYGNMRVKLGIKDFTQNFRLVKDGW